MKEQKPNKVKSGQKEKEKQPGRDKTLKTILNSCFYEHLSNTIQATDPIGDGLSQLQIGIERCGQA